MKDAYDTAYRLFFAYGSNMNHAQISLRCHSPKVVAVAKLADYKLSFYGHNKRWDGAEATVERHAGGEVWGVVYKLTFSDAEYLDSWQDIRLDGTGPYFHYPVEVTDTAGTIHNVLLYEKDLLGTQELPSEEYLAFILAGAREHGLPSDYVEKLRKTETRKARYAVPATSKFDGTFLFDRCSNCEESGANADHQVLQKTR